MNTSSFTVPVENLKCGGCAHTITSSLAALEGVGEVHVDVDKSLVSFETEASKLPAVKDKLRALGYPEQGTVEGLQSGLAQAKSYVSCAIGKLT